MHIITTNVKLHVVNNLLYMCLLAYVGTVGRYVYSISLCAAYTCMHVRTCMHVQQIKLPLPSFPSLPPSLPSSSSLLPSPPLPSYTPSCTVCLSVCLSVYLPSLLPLPSPLPSSHCILSFRFPISLQFSPLPPPPPSLPFPLHSTAYSKQPYVHRVLQKQLYTRGKTAV